MNEDYSFDSITVDMGALDPVYGAIPPTVTIDPAVYTSVTGPAWTAGTNGLTWQTDDFNITDARPSGKLTLQGEDADIEINGRSLIQILDSIEQRLGLLKMHEAMEQQWEELRAIGDQYRTKLAEIENKVRMWDTLKR